MKEFGNLENLTNPELPQSGSSPSSVSPVSSKHLNAGVSPPQSATEAEVVPPPTRTISVVGKDHPKTAADESGYSQQQLRRGRSVSDGFDKERDENADESSDDEVCVLYCHHTFSFSSLFF